MSSRSEMSEEITAEEYEAWREMGRREQTVLLDSLDFERKRVIGLKALVREILNAYAGADCEWCRAAVTPERVAAWLDQAAPGEEQAK
jgi:hypothetical protein